MAQLARPKVRSRAGGSAIPLDADDKQLLNLMQGSFALTERPFAHVAGLAGLQEAEVLERVERLLKALRQHGALRRIRLLIGRPGIDLVIEAGETGGDL